MAGWARQQQGHEGPSCQALTANLKARDPQKSQLINLLNEKGKQRLTEMREGRDSGPEPTPLRSVPRLLRV